jgi:hypothetical protein
MWIDTGVGKIFISYRKDDSASIALNIAQSLQREFGVENVFHDIDLKAGQRFPAILKDYLDQCSALLAIIGPHWSNVQDQFGKRRLDDESDWVRLEIATALRRRISVIPVLVEGAPLPPPSELPSELCGLLDHQAATITTTRYRHEISGLIRDLRQLLPSRLRMSAIRLFKWSLRSVLLGLFVGYALFVAYPIFPGYIKAMIHTPTLIPPKAGERNILVVPTDIKNAGLTLVDIGVNEKGYLDIKLKNSSDDSAYLTGVRFVLSDGHYYGCGDPGCVMMAVGGTLYYFKIRVRTNEHSLEVKADDQQIMPISQQVPPKGVDRILVQLGLINTGNAWGHQLTYSFKCRVELIYDGGKRLLSPEFRIAFR